ncbi:MAG TPA: hypothetical protein VMY80_07955, partial [Anaerolineae bacterium]|nr:hypothetical protein [Anaerolineae bacterium]
MVGKTRLLEIVDRFGTPLYVYDAARIRENLARIRNTIQYRPLRIHFAVMSNANLALLRLVRGCGAGVHASSPGELALATRAGFGAAEIVVTGCNFTEPEIEKIARARCAVNADSLGQMEKFIRIGGLREVGIRLNSEMKPPRGAINVAVGHNSRLGMDKADIPRARRLAERSGARLVGLQMYSGTNILDPRHFLRELDELIAAAREFPDLRYIDLGGGFGIPYRESQRPFDWRALEMQVSPRMNSLSRGKQAPVELKLEPGRCVIGDAGVLVSRVVDVKRRSGTVFVGCDTGLSNFARPYVYGQFHRTTVIYRGRTRGKRSRLVICGNTVAARDILSEPMPSLPAPREG